VAEFMHESIVFCSACTMSSSLQKFTFAISSPDEFLVATCVQPVILQLSLSSEQQLLSWEYCHKWKYSGVTKGEGWDRRGDTLQWVGETRKKFVAELTKNSG